MAKREAKISEKAYVANYPPLRDFLRSIEARCDWQLPLGEEPFRCFVEQWRAPSGGTMIVTIRPNGNGWDIATPCGSLSIETTLEDVRVRLGLVDQPKSKESKS